MDLDQPLDISIALRNGSINPNCYGSEHPIFRPIEGENFIGSVAQGGPCNHHRISFSPHGNGTHTECVGHLTAEDIFINDCLTSFFFLARLVSVAPKLGHEGDMKIHWSDLENHVTSNIPQALIIRTMPNQNSKKAANYSNTNPAYLDPMVAQQLALLDIMHLLIDLPSVDKEADEGKLEGHHAFWNYPDNPRLNCTITELIYVPNSIPDGDYLLNLQIASLESDASPSKPVLYAIVNNS